MSALKQTPLFEAHRRIGARMFAFGGWSMPVSYTGIAEEHRAVRERAGAFDLSHMGEIEIAGAEAGSLLQRLITNDLERLRDGMALYTPMCLPNGGVVDDLIVYRFTRTKYWIVPNAANIEKVLEWTQRHAPRGVEARNLSDETALIAVQGPQSDQVAGPLTDAPIEQLRFMQFLPRANMAGVETSLSRTGYTGERGVEMYCAAADAERLWEALLESAARIGGLPCGLGARDTLRLEARLCLYGNDLTEETTPLEAGLGWTVALHKPDFIGREALLRQKESGPRRRMMGFQMLERSAARPGCAVFREGERIGTVCSGGPSPTLGVNIGLAYVQTEHAKIGRKVEVEVRGKPRSAKIVRTPFYSSPHV